MMPAYLQENDANLAADLPDSVPASADTAASAMVPIETLSTSAVVPLAEGPQSDVEQQVYDWLKRLDGGRGCLLQYFSCLRDEFDSDFAQIAAAKLQSPINPGTLGSIDPAFFEAAGVKQTGHRLLLAKGILALPT